MLKLLLRLSLAACCLSLSTLAVSLGFSRTAVAAGISGLAEDSVRNQATFLVELDDTETGVAAVNYYVSPNREQECDPVVSRYSQTATKISTSAEQYQVDFSDSADYICLMITSETESSAERIYFRGFGVNVAPAAVEQVTASAGTSPGSGDVCGGSGRYFLGVPSWDRGLGDCDSITSEELLGGDKALLVALNIMAILTHLAAFIAIGFVIFGGFKFVLSTGNADQATDARKTIINAGIGAAIVIMARVLVEVIYKNLIGG